MSALQVEGRCIQIDLEEARSPVAAAAAGPTALEEVD